MLMLFSLRRLFSLAPNKASLFALMLLVFPLPYYFSHPDLTYRQPIEPIIVMLVAYALVPARESATEHVEAVTPEDDEAYAVS
jgi:hypothetical protein